MQKRNPLTRAAHRRIPAAATKPALVFAGDIGGTKCNLALFPVARNLKLKPFFQRRYTTGNYQSFEELLTEFLKDCALTPRQISHVAFASAGMLVKSRFQAVNLPWPVNEERIAHKLELKRVLLLNDLEATARSLDHLSAKDFVTLNRGVKQERAAKALLAAGTGLGAAILVWERDRYRALPSEAGQADFAPRTEQEIELLRCLRKQHENVCSEDVLSGRGFRRIHEFLSPNLRHASFDSGNAAEEITRLALAGACSVCRATLDLWVGIYGAAAGNLALNVLAFGGVYIAGGIALKILPKLKDGNFFCAFCDKGNNMGPTLARVPVRVVLNEDAPLLGAAYAALAE